MAVLYEPGHVRLLVTLPGDVTCDGIVDQADWDIMASAMGSGDCWQLGDVNGDGVVSFADHVVIANHFGQAVDLGKGSEMHVPEPSGLLLLVSCLTAVAAVRRRRNGRPDSV